MYRYLQQHKSICCTFAAEANKLSLNRSLGIPKRYNDRLGD